MKKSDQAATLASIANDAGITVLPTRRTRVVAVTGGKGGVGKSTVASNLACAWARRGANVLAMDGDVGMADLNLLLGLAPERSLLDLLNGVAIEDILVEAHGIHLLPALNGSFQLANMGAQARDHLLNAVASLGDRFDTLVVDTPAGIGDNAIAFAGAAVDVVVVATPEPLSLADAYACLKVLSTRAGVTRALVLPNAVRSPAEADEVVGRLRALNDRFLGITLEPLPPIPWDGEVRGAAAAGTPLVISSPESPASRALVKAARRIDALSRPSENARGVMARWFERAALKQPQLRSMDD